MRRWTFHRRSLWFYRRTNMAVALGVVAGASAMTGALLVGDSMRGSLRELALGRLGRVDYTLSAPVLFREGLASDLTAAQSDDRRLDTSVPVLILRGGATHADTHARVEGINVFGVDDRYWSLSAVDGTPPVRIGGGRSIILNERLARELGAKPGDDVLVRMGRPAAIPHEALLGRKDDTTLTLRLTVDAIVEATGMGAFTLSPKQHVPHNAYIPLATLQRALGRPGRVNTLLLSTRPGETASQDQVEHSETLLKQVISLDDLGLTIRPSEAHGYVALESEAMLLQPAIEEAAMEAARAIGVGTATRILTYLANRITHLSPEDPSEPVRSIPYSTVTALDDTFLATAALTTVAAERPAIGADGILLNDWAAADLHAQRGDRIALTYYINGPLGRLDERTTTFTLRGVLPLSGAAADPGFTPPYPGITDVRSIADWDPPFPIELGRIRDKDEAYWTQYRTVPKAFISLDDGQRLWAEQGERFGKTTSVRILASDDADLDLLATQFQKELLGRLELAKLGMIFDPVRARALEAGRGSTDFGGLFIGFSLFLIVSAALLVALLFRLGVEQRAREIGLLLAVGCEPRTVMRFLIVQGAIIAVVGAAIGLATAHGYAWLMLAALRSWWSEAVNAPFLRLHGSAGSFAIGFAASFLTAMISMAWSIRGLTRLAPRPLLAGAVAAGPLPRIRHQGCAAPIVAVVAVAAALGLIGLHAASDVPSRSLAFFGSGAAALVASLVFLTGWLRAGGVHPIHKPGPRALASLGVRNATRHPSRSLLTVALIASATFLVTSLEAFRIDADATDGGRESGTGGYTLYAESAVPLPSDLNSQDGREQLALLPSTAGALDGTTVMPCRLRSGDETSCLNLYQPNKPRILGVPDAMIRRGGFTFASTLASSSEARKNPWTLLTEPMPEGVIPVIGDESAVLWQLHLGLGKDLLTSDERGNTVRLRFVGLLSGSVLQGELLVAEPAFIKLFPSITGHAFFLIDTPIATASTLTTHLERDLAPFGFDVGSTARRLGDYLAVQNTYLTTFEMLGGLGLVLGTVGLGAVLLRNVWERRSELALMQALGFSRRSLGAIVMAENASLVVTGLLAGFLPSLVAVAPHLTTRPSSLPWLSVGLTLATVLIVGVGVGLVAVIPALRAPLLPALRSE